MIEIASIRSTLEYLVDEVQNLKAQSRPSQSSLLEALPDPPSGYNPKRISLEKMSEEQFKNFRISRTFSVWIYLLLINLLCIIYFVIKLRTRSYKFFSVWMTLCRLTIRENGMIFPNMFLKTLCQRSTKP